MYGQGQDWEPVVFKKKKLDEKKPHVEVSPLKKFDENKESFEHKKIPKALADAVKNARVSKSLTQDQLAKSVNERPCIVNDIENARGVYDHTKINKVLRALGLSLKNIK
jgi:putative transcription factor